LIVTRKLGQAVRVGDDVRVVVMEVRGKQVRLGIEAPADVQLYREAISEEEREQYRLRPDAETAGEE
jgi:carbon storage regulator